LPPADPHPGYARIYAVVAAIPEGRVATYGQVAALAGLAGHARQVGYALHALPAGSGLPWQRVINARGEISPRSAPGYEGYQRFLLEEEGVELDPAGRVDLDRFCWDPDHLPPRQPGAGRSGRGPGARRQAPREPGARSLSRGPRAAADLAALRAPGAAALDAEVEAIASALRPLGSRRRAVGEKVYLKSDLEFFGLDVPTLRRQARAWLRAHPRLAASPARELLPLARALWQRPVHDLRAFAVELLMAAFPANPASAREARQALDLFEWMLRRSGSWAYVDAIAVQLVGPLVARRPALAARLDRWSADPDFWLRRSALLALLLPLRRGGGDWERFVRHADGMLGEREFFIRKAIGWVLREVGKQRPRLVREFLAPRLDRVSGLTLREAVKHLPAADRQELLAPRAHRPRSRQTPK
jgi:alkylated DNA nucleotide flippase Atl1/3-methyladenine DNA glycosylase AlkD